MLDLNSNGSKSYANLTDAELKQRSLDLLNRRLRRDAEKAEAARPRAFEATPLDWDAMLAVDSREWVYGHFLIKKFISVLGAPGGTGKTAYAFAIALSVAIGRDLLNEHVHAPGPVWIYNLEDPLDELMRRIRAACQHHGLPRHLVEGQLFLDSGRDRPLIIAESTKDGTVIASPVVDELIAELKYRGIRLLIVDPFIKSHKLSENDNDQIDAAATLWAQVANDADCSILLVHHFKKGGISGDAAAFRGASALIDASRAAVSLATMSEDEAKRLGVEPLERWQYIRADNAKLNLAPPPEATTWLQLTSVDLDNGRNDRASDRVQTVLRWEPPTAWDDMPWSTVHAILEAMERGPGDGELWTNSARGNGSRWAGRVVMEKAAKGQDAARTIIASWVESGVLEVGEYRSPGTRKTVSCVRVNQLKVAEMRRVSVGFGDALEC